MRDELLTVPQAAARRGITPARVRGYIHRGLLTPVPHPPGYLGRATDNLVRAVDVDALVVHDRRGWPRGRPRARPTPDEYPLHECLRDDDYEEVAAVEDTIENAYPW